MVRSYYPAQKPNDDVILFPVTRVYLVGSTPGRYVGQDMERWGHLRLRKVRRCRLSLLVQSVYVCVFGCIGAVTSPIASAVKMNLIDLAILHSCFCHFYCRGICHCVFVLALWICMYHIRCSAFIPDCIFCLAPFSVLPPSYYFVSCCMITLIPFLATRRGQ